MNLQTMSPAAGETASGAREASLGGVRPEHSHPHRNGKAELTFRLPPDHRPMTVTGRQAETLALLIQCGAAGFTTGEASPLGWARRVSAYVGKLRALGVPIVTTWERAGDARIGRYALSGPVVVITGGGR